MWMSLVAMKVWMRGRSESLIAFQAASMSCTPVRASPQIDGALDLARDRLHGLEVARRGDREAGLDHVHAEPRELVRDLDLLLPVERDPRRLLAVAQRRVEDPYPVLLAPLCSALLAHADPFLLVACVLLRCAARGRHALFPPKGEKKEKPKVERGTSSAGSGRTRVENDLADVLALLHVTVGVAGPARAGTPWPQRGGARPVSPAASGSM